MAHPIRRFAATATVLSLLFAVFTGARAQGAYPSKSVEVILPYAAGGGVDMMSRAFAREASQLTGQQWVVVNRPGGAGLVGFSALANAAPDGYTAVFSPASALTNSPFLVTRMPFRNEQIEPVCQVFENVFAIAVRADSPIKSLDDLVTTLEGVLPPTSGTVLRIIDIPPEPKDPAERERAAKASFGKLFKDADHNPKPGQHPGMHTTTTVDYAILLSGELVAIMDDGEVVMQAGDVLIQRGTNHGWSNRSDAPARIAFILIDGQAPAR